MEQPTIGRIVHYQDKGQKTVPAIITKVNDDETVSLTIFHPEISANGVTQPGYITFETEVPGSEEPAPRHWNWPPRK